VGLQRHSSSMRRKRLTLVRSHCLVQCALKLHEDKIEAAYGLPIATFQEGLQASRETGRVRGRQAGRQASGLAGRKQSHGGDHSTQEPGPAAMAAHNRPVYKDGEQTGQRADKIGGKWQPEPVLATACSCSHSHKPPTVLGL
jgi:predicted transposase YdaD